MTFPSRKAAIVGVYNTKQAKMLEGTSWTLALEAIQGALDDAGLKHEQIDGLGSMMYDASLRAQQQWTEQLGGHPITFTSHGMAAGLVTKAAAAIGAGLTNVVCIYFGNAGVRAGPSKQRASMEAAQIAKAPRVPDWDFNIHGGYMTAWYALWTRRYMDQFNAPYENLAEYPVIARHHATLNPASIMGERGEITVQDVIDSPMISDPLHRLDCSLDNDGGYAIIVASAEIAKDCRKDPVWVLGGGEAMYTDFYMSFTDDWINDNGQAVRRASEIAFGNSGISHDEIDVTGLYDCFPVTMARNLEEMGFCKFGEGHEFIKEGHLKLGGKLPANTDGGLLSHSHCGNPSGLPVVEVVKQLRGECDQRQVKDAKIGAVLSQGFAVHGLTGISILGKD
ncbi:MAG: thiolase family protein [Sphingomonadaceae bacterium]|nr:thiolase family protein [Sphingomonadaceae bacterium]